MSQKTFGLFKYLCVSFSLACAPSPSRSPESVVLYGFSSDIPSGRLEVYTLDRHGVPTFAVSAPLDAGGLFNVISPASPYGLELRAIGPIIDPVSKKSLAGATLHARVSVYEEQRVAVFINALDEIAYSRCLALQGAFPERPAILAANRQTLGLVSGIGAPLDANDGPSFLMPLASAGKATDITAVAPIIGDPKSANSMIASMLQAFAYLSEVAQSNANYLTVIQALAQDFSNGALDGIDNAGNAVMLGNVSAPSSAAAWQTLLISAIAKTKGSVTPNASPALTVVEDNGTIPMAQSASASQNGGAAAFCSCQFQGACQDFTGSIYATLCADLLDTCISRAVGAVFQTGSCPTMGKKNVPVSMGQNTSVLYFEDSADPVKVQSLM